MYVPCGKTGINPHFPHSYPQKESPIHRVFGGFPKLSTDFSSVHCILSTDFGLFRTRHFQIWSVLSRFAYFFCHFPVKIGGLSTIHSLYTPPVPPSICCHTVHKCYKTISCICNLIIRYALSARNFPNLHRSRVFPCINAKEKRGFFA